MYQDLLAKGSIDKEIKIIWRFNLNKAIYSIKLATDELDKLKSKLILVQDISTGLIELN